MPGLRLSRYFFVLLLTGAVCAQPPAQSRRKKLLAVGDVRTGFQHDSVSHALATIERLGRETGLYDTFIRTDSQLLTKQPISVGERKNVNAKNLNHFDALFYFGTGEGDLSSQQKSDLMSFIKEDGKGFIGAHTGDDAYFTWPEFGEMVGGYFDNHPWGVFEAPIVVEDTNFPAMKMFPKTFTIRDEIYQHKDFSRDKVHVLARVDSSKVDLTNKNVHRTDKDFPVAWAKMYGKGRVFYSTFGHTDEVWDNPNIQKMYLEAIKWALRLTGDDIVSGPGAISK
jgi:type 1 glutamine amidotransferase